jgi:hypothetical protein
MRDSRPNCGTNALAYGSNPPTNLSPDIGTDLSTNYVGSDDGTDLSSNLCPNLSTNRIATRRNIFTHLQPDSCADNRGHKSRPGLLERVR